MHLRTVLSECSVWFYESRLYFTVPLQSQQDTPNHLRRMQFWIGSWWNNSLLFGCFIYILITNLFLIAHVKVVSYFSCLFPIISNALKRSYHICEISIGCSQKMQTNVWFSVPHHKVPVACHTLSLQERDKTKSRWNKF